MHSEHSLVYNIHNCCENAVLAASVLGLALAVAFGSMLASRNLHTGLLSRVMRCPMSFFDTTPLGRIVNRFSKDIDIVDSNIPQFAQNFLITFAPLVSTVIVITYSTPIFIAVAIPLVLIFVVIQVRCFSYCTDVGCRSYFTSVHQAALSGY